MAVGSNRVVTVAHTLRGATAISVSGSSATLVAIDHRRDLAVLDTARLRPRPVPARFTDPVVGAAFLERLDIPGVAVRHSPVSVVNVAPIEIDEPRDSTRYRRDGFVAKLTLPDDAVESGDSGSPIVDGRGRVVGLVFATDRSEGHSAFATASSEIEMLLRSAGHEAVPTGPCDL